MKDSEKANNDATPVDATETAIGDVETAGETTAADTISGPTDSDSVGADTMLKVSDSPRHDIEH